MMRKNNFTLLEIMVALTLLLLAGGVFSWKMHQMVEKKRFTASCEKLRSRLLICRSLAMNMQTDWKGVLYHLDGSWRFESCPSEDVVQTISPLALSFSKVCFNGEQKKEYMFDFSATGDVLPAGRLDVYGAEAAVQLKFPEIFALESGTQAGPMHPEDLRN